MSAPKLIATDTVHAIPVSLLGGLSYLALGHTDIELLGWLALGSIPAAYFGSQLAAYAPKNIIKTILALVLVFAGAKLMI
jgi:uncharacterized membrane protein YfcA